MTKTCEHCRAEFETFKPSDPKRFCSRACWYAWTGRIQDRACGLCSKAFRPSNSVQKFCGPKCRQVASRTATRRTACAACGKALSSTVHSRVRFCSRSCAMRDRSRRGQLHRPEGARQKHSSGYMLVKVVRTWVMEHRFVMEQVVGRPLEQHERVHHKNGNRSDNRPENLELWKVKKKDPAGVRAADYHCAGCRCFEEK